MIALLTLLLSFLILGVSWFATCGVVYLITLCFGLEFSWLIATGIWLILILVKGALKVTIKKE